MNVPAMDRAAMLRHLTTVYGSAPAAWWFNLLSGAAGEPPNRVQWHRVDRLETAAAAAVRLVQTGQNVYLSQAITDAAGRQAALKRNQHGRISTAEAKGLVGAWAELDLAVPGHAVTNLPPTAAAALAGLAATGLPSPALVIHSGGGLHVWWLFAEPFIWETDEERAEVMAAVKGVGAAVERVYADHGWHLDRTFDAARVLRLAGSLNLKTDTARPVQLLTDDGPRVTLDDLAPFATEARHAPAPSTPIAPGARLPARTRLAIAAAIVEHWTTGQRRPLALAVAGWLAQHGVPELDTRLILLAVCEAAELDDDLAYVQRIVKDTYTKAAAGRPVEGWAALTDASRPLVTPATATSLDHLVARRGAPAHPNNVMMSSESISGDISREGADIISTLAKPTGTAAEIERWRAAYHRIRCIAQRRHAHSLALERELADLRREIAHPAYRGRVHIVEAVAQAIAISRPEPDGSYRLVKESLAEKLGTGVGTINATLAPAIACGATVERVVTSYNKEKRQPTTACYLDFPGLTRSDDPTITRSRVRAQLLTAPAVRRTGKTGKTAGGARPGAGRRICPDCGALSVIQQERRARAYILDCGHTIYELGEPTETTNPQAPMVQSIWDAYRDRHLRLPDGTAATLVTLGVTADVDAGIAYFRVAGESQLRRLGLDELDAVTIVAGRANQLDWADAASEWAEQSDAPLNTESGPINLIGPPAPPAGPEPPVVDEVAWADQLDWPATCVCGQPAIRGAPEGAVCGRCILYRRGGAVGTWPLPAGDIPVTYGTAADD